MPTDPHSRKTEPGKAGLAEVARGLEELALGRAELAKPRPRPIAPKPVKMTDDVLTIMALVRQGIEYERAGRKVAAGLAFQKAAEWCGVFRGEVVTENVTEMSRNSKPGPKPSGKALSSAERKRRQRAKRKRRHPPEAENLSPPVGPFSDDPAQRWQWAVGVSAGNVIAQTAAWNRGFPGWRKYEVPPWLLKVVLEAAAAWSDLVDHLNKRRSSDGKKAKA